MSASKKWLYLFADIVAYEVNHSSDGQLLSEAADRLVLRAPILGRLFIIVVGFVITVHLANAIPVKYDLMAMLFWKRWRREIGRLQQEAYSGGPGKDWLRLRRWSYVKRWATYMELSRLRGYGEAVAEIGPEGHFPA